MLGFCPKDYIYITDLQIEALKILELCCSENRKFIYIISNRRNIIQGLRSAFLNNNIECETRSVNILQIIIKEPAQMEEIVIHRREIVRTLFYGLLEYVPLSF